MGYAIDPDECFSISEEQKYLSQLPGDLFSQITTVPDEAYHWQGGPPHRLII